MIFGYQTISWGEEIPDLDRLLSLVQATGFSGIELAQNVQSLAIEYGELKKKLAEKNLKLFGLAGGSIESRVDYVDEFFDGYFYVEDFSDALENLSIPENSRCALHPHVFKAIQNAVEAERLLEKYPRLMLLPDTAHLHIVGDDALSLIKNRYKRLAGVHLKDWTPEYGRSVSRYARGFCNLGEGRAKAKNILSFLKKSGFDRPIIIEQDFCENGAEESLRSNANWLCANKFLKQDPFPALEKSEAEPMDPAPIVSRNAIELFERFTKHSRESLYRQILAELSIELDCHFVSLWSCSEANDSMALLAVTKPAPFLEPSMRLSRTWSYEAVRHGEPMVFRVQFRDRVPEDFLTPQIVEEFPECKFMVSIPVKNPANANHVRFVITAFPNWQRAPSKKKLAKLKMFAREAGFFADMVLDMACTFAGGRINLIAADSGNSIEFAERIAEFLKEYLCCEAVSIFEVDERRGHLSLKCSTGNFVWLTSNEYYLPGEGLTGTVWQTKRPIVCDSPSIQEIFEGKSTEVDSYVLDSYASVPLIDADGIVTGVVRCCNKKSQIDSHPSSFTEDDLAIVDAVGQTALPHLGFFKREEIRELMQARVNHELNTPVSVIVGAVDIIKDTLRKKKINTQSLFKYDYLEDISTWCDLLKRLILNSDFMQYDELPLEISRIRIVGDIVAPAVRHMRAMLSERSFPANSITYSFDERLPLISGDKNLLVQMVFNLLANSIKYAYADPDAFNVDIEIMRRGNGLQLDFYDDGMGIEEELEERIFDEGVRGDLAIKKHISGHGIGLWIVARIVRAHNGTIKLVSNAHPTHFRVRLGGNSPKRMA